MANFIQSLQPIVLVGGRSSRFGRDKLREPIAGDSLLVDRPIAALREVFGPCVLLVGECDPAVAARGDGTLRDDHPGIGPLGGILSGLACGKDLFVLPGDLPAVDADLVRTIVEAAGRAPAAWAVLASTGRTEPCVGIYRQAARVALESHRAKPTAPLGAAIPAQQLAVVPVDAERLVNLNTMADLAATRARGSGA